MKAIQRCPFLTRRMGRAVSLVRCFCLLLACLGATQAQAMDRSETVLVIDRAVWTGSGTWMPPELTGFNLLYWIDHQALYESGQLVEEIRAIQPSFLRYPAGTASQNYDWVENRVINTRLYPFDSPHELLTTDAFISILKQTDADAFVCVDIASAHLKDRERAVRPGDDAYTVAQPVSEEEEQAMVEKAVAWVRHFKANGISPIYELGNEHYLAFLDFMVFTPEMYVEKCRRFILAIRAEDPDARFGIGGPSRFYGPHWHYRDAIWWPAVLKELASEVDKVIVHTYWAAHAIHAGLDAGAPYAAFLREMHEWGRTEGIPTEHLQLGFTEWGARDLHDRDAYGAFVFLTLTQMAQHGVSFAVQWPFRWRSGDGQFGRVQLIDQDSGERYFAFHAMAAWSHFVGGKTLLQPPTAVPGADGVRYIAAADDAGFPLLALTHQGSEPQTIQIQVDWPELIRQVTVIEVSSSGIRETGTVPVNEMESTELEPGIIRIMVGK